MTKQTFEPVSHYRQLHDPSCQFKPNINRPVTEDIFTTVEVEEDGILKQKQVLAKVNLKDRYKGMKCSDFAMANLVACGAIDSLRPITISGNPNIEQIENAIANLEAFTDTAEQLKSQSVTISQTTSEND